MFIVTVFFYFFILSVVNLNRQDKGMAGRNDKKYEKQHMKYALLQACSGFLTFCKQTATNCGVFEIRKVLIRHVS